MDFDKMITDNLDKIYETTEENKNLAKRCLAVA